MSFRLSALRLVAAGALAAAIAATALPAAPSAPAALPTPFGTTAGKAYRSSVWKFSLNVFDDWNEVPIEIGEKYEVAKWYEPGSKGEVFPRELSIFRLNLRPGGDDAANGQGPATEGGSEEERQLRQKIREMQDEAAPKSIYGLAFDRLRGFDDKKYPEDKNWKPVVSKDKVNGKFWVIEIPFTSKPNPDETLCAMLIGFEKEGVSYGVRLICTARRRDNFEGLMKSIAKSFLFFDEKAKDVQSLSVLDGINISPKRRSDIEKGMVKGWEVIVSPKKNYIVVYNTKGDRNKELAHVLADRIEKIREQVYEKQFPPSKPIDAVSVMRVCGDRKEYQAYGGPAGTGGYWNDGTEELVFYDASPSRKIDDDTVAVLYHEAFHQYIYYSVGNVAPHSWFNEGHGDYYAGAKYGTTKFRIEPFNWRVGVIKTALNQGPRTFTTTKDDKGNEHKQWGGAGYTPLKDFVAFSQGEYYSYPDVCYAQGWSLIYFLREEVPRKKEWNAKWGKILPTYFEVLKREVQAREARRHGDDGPPAPPPDGGDGTPPTKPGGDGGDDAAGAFQPPHYGHSSRSALEQALAEAFMGVDFAELEAAWVETMKHVN